MGYSAFDDFDDAGGQSDFDSWSELLDFELRKHRVDPKAFTLAERIAAYAEGDDTANLAEEFARSHYAALAGYDNVVAPGDQDDPTDFAFGDVRSMSQFDSEFDD